MFSSLMNFLRRRLWSALPETVTTRQRAWAALLWGGALIALGVCRAKILLTIGGAALAALLLAPATGSGVYLGVMRFFSVIGFIVSNVLLTLIFYFFVTPMGWVLRLSGKDLLDTRSNAPPAWREHTGKPDRKRYYRLS